MYEWTHKKTMRDDTNIVNIDSYINIFKGSEPSKQLPNGHFPHRNDLNCALDENGLQFMDTENRYRPRFRMKAFVLPIQFSEWLFLCHKKLKR